MSHATIRRLRLAQAAEAELAAVANLLPPTPGLDRLVRHAPDMAAGISAQLESGWTATPQLVAGARKPGHGIRPVPVVAVQDRILYRALVDFVLRNSAPLDRGPEAYLNFVQAPVLYAAELAGGPVSVFRSQIRYVVRTDITAFYQYVDHGILASELLAASPDFDVVTALFQLLHEILGRDYGLPQLLDPSDRLSDIYADIVERDLLRRGLAVWRFNDDFRIACRNYAETLRAVEALDEAAREVGLVISEYKTTTPKFQTYAFEVLDLGVNDTIDPDAVEEIEDTLVEEDPYVDLDDELELENALSTLSSAGPGLEEDEAGIDLETVRGSDLAKLRKALRTVTRLRIPDALPFVVEIVRYVPYLTPAVCKYFLSLAEGDSKEDMAEVFDDLRRGVALSDWQGHWMVHTCRVGRLLRPTGDPGPAVSERVAWLQEYWKGNVLPLLRAETALALASVAGVGVAEIEYRLRNDPTVLRPWYLMAVDLLREADAASVSEQYWQGLIRSSPLARWLLTKNNADADP